MIKFCSSFNEVKKAFIYRFPLNFFASVKINQWNAVHKIVIKCIVLRQEESL